MDWLTKQKTYVWLIVVLVVINLTTLILLWIDRPSAAPQRHEKFRGTDYFLKSDLGLSDEQNDLFKQSRDKFFEVTHSLNDLMWEKKKEFRDEGFRQNSDLLKVKLLTVEIENLQSQIEQSAFKHFSEVSPLLNAEQIEKFKKMLDKKPGHPHRPGDDRHQGPPPFGNPPPG